MFPQPMCARATLRAGPFCECRAKPLVEKLFAREAAAATQGSAEPQKSGVAPHA